MKTRVSLKYFVCYCRLGGVQRLEVLGQSLDLRQVFQLEWVIVVGKSNIFISEARLWILGDSSLRTSEVFLVHFP